MSENQREGLLDVVTDEAKPRLQQPPMYKVIVVNDDLGPKEELSGSVRESLARHRGALQAYRGARWNEAEAAWAELARREPERRLYGLYLERVRQLRVTPPPVDWDGVFVFKTK